MTTPHTSKLILENAHIAHEIFTLRPDYHALLIIVDGITPGPSDSTTETMLRKAETSVRTKLSQISSINAFPHIAAWREAYKGFGAMPNKTWNSLEALTRRVESGGLPRVNRLTDIYNAISIEHQIPLAGEGLEKYQGAPFLVRATGKEKFEVMSGGETVVENPVEGAVVWCDEGGFTCRRWNWRQGPRTALTDETRRALFILDALEPMSDEDLLGAAEELAFALKELGPDVRIEQRVISSSA